MSERMTEEAIRVSIEEAGVAEPVFEQVAYRTYHVIFSVTEGRRNA